MGHKYQSGFTIVELLIVIVVIAILVAVSIVAYNGIQNRAVATTLKSDLRNAATQIGIAKAENDRYSTDSSATLATLNKSTGTTLQYTSDGSSYCLTATSIRSGVPAYHISNGGSIEEGLCVGHTLPIAAGDPIQTVTAANCPTNRTAIIDTRDNRSYWIMKLADGKCWMLTNLAYAGGGNNTYGDVKTITLSSVGGSYAEARYYIPTNANPTTYPAEPSVSTDGGVSTPQYGYFYNSCAAMGVQLSTRACSNTSAPDPNSSISICAAGWRLPTIAEYSSLNTAINGGSTTVDTSLRTIWLGQYAGRWDGASGSFVSTGAIGFYATSSTFQDLFMYPFYHYNSQVANGGAAYGKMYGNAVRCVAAS